MAHSFSPAGIFGSFKALVKRVALHFLALCAALAIARAGLTGTLCAYVGIICLIPIGFDLGRPRFLVPFAVAAGQFFLLWLLGQMPPAFALFWAGVQTWLLQALISRFKLGWAWSAMPAILLGIGLSYNQYVPKPLFLALATACGYLAYFLITIRTDKLLLSKSLDGLVSLLEPVLRQRTFPRDFDSQLRRLLAQSTAARRLGSFKQGRISAKLQPPMAVLQPRLEQAVGWTEEKFEQQDANYLLASLSDLNNLLSEALQGEKNAAISGSGGHLAAPGDSGELAQFNASASQLLAKRNKLPENLQKHINALYLSTGSIILCMREDPEDVHAGTRFLNRYLPAVHKVVDEYIRLTDGHQTQENIQAMLGKSEELLARLAVAFHEEHGNLLRNDAMRFTADLNVLDKLLKMDGR